jgi:hypothetical protein
VRIPCIVYTALSHTRTHTPHALQSAWLGCTARHGGPPPGHVRICATCGAPGDSLHACPVRLWAAAASGFASKAQQLLMRHQLLRHHSDDAHHCRSTVIKFPVLHEFNLFWRARSQTQRIEPQITRQPPTPNREGCRFQLGSSLTRDQRPHICELQGLIEREDARYLEERDSEKHCLPKLLERGGLECDIRRHIDTTTKERGQ